MNLETTINIDQMTVGEKLGLMERLRRDLSSNPANIDIPEWHLRKQKEAEKAIADGTDEFIDLEVFEAELRDRINSRSTR